MLNLIRRLFYFYCHGSEYNFDRMPSVEGEEWIIHHSSSLKVYYILKDIYILYPSVT